MSGVLTGLADGLAAEINAHTFTTAFDFDAVRSWADFDVKLEDDETDLRVDVVPVGHTTAELDDRGGVHYVTQADIGLRYKFPPTDTQETNGRIDPAQIDALSNLTEQIIELLESENHQRLDNYTAATFGALEVRTVAPRNYLRDHRQYLAILRLSYDVRP